MLRIMFKRIGYTLVVLIVGGIFFLAGYFLSPNKEVANQNKTTSQAKAHVQDIDRVGYSILDLPAVLPDKRSYALEISMTVNKPTVTRWQSLLKEHKYIVHEIPVIGPDGGEWLVIAAGNYSSPQKAQEQRLKLQQAIPESIGSSLRVIQLPP